MLTAGRLIKARTAVERTSIVARSVGEASHTGGTVGMLPTWTGIRASCRGMIPGMATHEGISVGARCVGEAGQTGGTFRSRGTGQGTIPCRLVESRTAEIGFRRPFGSLCDHGFFGTLSLGKAREVIWTLAAQTARAWRIAIASGLDEVVATVEGILVSTGGECETTQANRTIGAFTLRKCIRRNKREMNGQMRFQSHATEGVHTCHSTL